MNKRFTLLAGTAAIALLVSEGVWAQQGISPDVVQQMQSIAQTKASFSAAQKKMDSNLAYGLMAATNDSRVSTYTNAIQPLSATDIDPSTQQPAPATASSSVLVEIVGSDVDAIANAVVAANGTVLSKYPQWNTVNASVPVLSAESLAFDPSVSKMSVPSGLTTHVGSLTSQGYISHSANQVVASGYNGSGVKVGVLSDSASASRIAALIGSGDLRPTATALPGLNGPSNGTDEGAAMMEIVQDMAPGADIIFATAYNTQTDFANNILALAAAGCKVIVDDITYFAEGVFQDGPVARAVNTVRAGGAIYFSAAGNSGSLTKGTSGTWEGDFVSGGAVSGVVGTSEGGVGLVHNFGTTASPQTYDVLTGTTTFISLKWSDPLGQSANDYDLYILNPAGTAITAFSAAGQSGTQDPYEAVSRSAGFAVNSRIVLVQYAGAQRALHLDTERGAVSIGTTGATFGHNAAGSTVTLGATYWNSAKTGTRPFTGAANTNETFSSDGPRKIFFNPNGAPITPGNVLFSTNGGTTLLKPDFSAADGVSTHTPGFLPFFGTSAAAPHAAGIAALILSAKPSYTPDQVYAAMKAAALDSMAAGADRDSGYGIPMANAAVQYALTH